MQTVHGAGSAAYRPPQQPQVFLLQVSRGVSPAHSFENTDFQSSPESHPIRAAEFAMCELPISHATHLAGGTLSLTRSAILLNGEDRPIFLRYRMSRAVTIRPVVTVFQFPPSAQQKTPIEFNRRSGTLMIFESIELWTGHKGSGTTVVQCQGE